MKGRVNPVGTEIASVDASVSFSGERDRDRWSYQLSTVDDMQSKMRWKDRLTVAMLIVSGIFLTGWTAYMIVVSGRV